MPRFFLPVEQAQGDLLTLSGADAAHLTGPLRMRPGDPVTVCDGAGTDIRCRILTAARDRVTLEVLARSPSCGESRCAITLFQCLPKGDKMEQIVQKAVELGAAAVVPVLSARCVSRPDPAAAEKKLRRWNQIALEAAKQSGRSALPPVAPLMGWQPALLRLAAMPHPMMLYEAERGGGLPGALPKTAEIGLLVGPEGGFSPQEAEQARSLGIASIGLGPRILRTETAGCAAIAVLQHITGNLS
ncbi:MAG: 16S rRNA (uracil(1498)-N(3))-methyltransferase [Clostridiales bacterium]|nr:16S rRNA (uracil(1498)-N(3))-methyltransferase [Clostridiales bacterium]